MAEVMALTHHERWDGTGYPRALEGNDIPLPGRLAAVADAFDAMTTDRPYRRRRTVDEALAVLDEERDRQFDGAVVDALMRGDRAALQPVRVPVAAF